MSIANEAYYRVNCYGIGRWLEAFAFGLGVTLPDVGLSPGVRLVTPRSSGVALTLYRLPDPWPATADPRDRIVLERVEFTPPTALPLGLDAATETPDSARLKLSSDTAGGSVADLATGDTRISFFMPAARGIELSFDTNLVGFGRVVLARLGIALDWRKADHDGASGKS